VWNYFWREIGDLSPVNRAMLVYYTPKCGFGHAATIQFGREFCTARRPACLDGPGACPLYDRCDRVGVDEVTRTVVDPTERSAGQDTCRRAAAPPA
jgi:adenine-specific DNA glycosylase